MSFAFGPPNLVDDGPRQAVMLRRETTPRGGDFESYCQRIGGLNAWRLPLQDSVVNSRFADLSELLEFTIRPEVERRLSNVSGSDFQHSFTRHLSSVVDSWQSHHLSAALATA